MTLLPKLDQVRLFPLSVNHYVGSYERYRSRQDVRRNDEVYRRKATVQGGLDDGWITGWLESFVQEYGMDKASMVLKDYLRIRGS